MTRGRETWNSYPSRRIVSIRIVRCSSPRPDTVHVSVDSVSSTRSATLRSSSRYSRSRTWREVTNFPSLPANGESFRVLDVGDGQSDLDALEPSEGDDLASVRLVHLDAFQAVEREQLRDPR